MEFEQEEVPIKRVLSDAAFEVDDRRRRKSCTDRLKKIAKMSFPFTKINIGLVFWILLVPFSICFSVTYTTFPDSEVRGEPLWRWFAAVLILVGGWVAWYVVAGILCSLVEFFFPRSLFTYYFVELRHTIAMSGLAVLCLMLLEYFLDDPNDDFYIERGCISVIVIAILYGFRMLGERYLLIHFARKEYFKPLQKLMFQEKIVFKLLQYRIRYEKSKRELKSRERQTMGEPAFVGGVPEEISPDVKLIDKDSFSSKISWFSPTDKKKPPAGYMLDQCEKYSDSKKFSFLNYSKDRDKLYKISNENLRQKLIDEDVKNITELIFKALRGHHGPITVDSFSIIFPDKPHRREAAFSVMSGGPLDTTIDKSDIEATVAHVFRSRQNASASLKGRGDIAKVLSRFTGLFFWSLMVVVVLLIFEVDILTVAVPYISILLSFSFMFGDSIQNMVHSAILILILHPFDVGDRIIVDNNPAVVVHQFSLSQTLAFRPDGRWVSIPNSQLYNANIINAHRSRSYTIVFKMDVEVTTSPAKLVELINETKELCEDHPVYLPKPLVTIDAQGDANSLEVEFWIETKLIPWYKPEKYQELKTDFILWVTERLIEKEITYEQPVLPVKIQGEKNFKNKKI